jgi:branched-subunit amino acid aminotransferase/4-amino-4-deoxychorismate lyase
MHLGEITEAAVYDSANELVANNNVVNGRVRITLFDESPTKLWGADERAGTTLLVVTGEFRTRPDTLRLGISPYLINSTSPTAGIKSCNYLENLMAADEAKGRGFDEAIRLNERGEVTSACMANVFWLANERLFTPSLRTGCLAGTTREFVMEDLDCEEVETGLEELRYADAIFLTSAGLGVVRVAELDGKGLEGEGHSILGLIPGT